MTKELDYTRNNRRDFDKGKLEDGISDNPMLLFKSWYQDAFEKNATDPHAVVLGTVNKDNKPSSRIVYMRDMLEEGYVIYTNYLSRKGTEITENPHVSMLFYWDVLERQVRIEGLIEKIDPLISDDYFNARPRLSQIGAWASEQSTKIPGRETLEERVEFFEKKYPNDVPRPPHWGGLIIKPTYYEFWQGRPGRLHDRICYQENGDKWEQYRIAP
ncbi:MAG: pyridoxamine 5'-phosphate oxidase [Crocinitomicaceae bacterium]|nr:pyridoxamine 5'-phosphate oxidase [Crocinitomicaceae bacterium]